MLYGTCSVRIEQTEYTRLSLYAPCADRLRHFFASPGRPPAEKSPLRPLLSVDRTPISVYYKLIIFCAQRPETQVRRQKRGMNMIREMQQKDCAAVARFWRDYLDVSYATDESVSRTFETMSRDSRYRTFVAEEDGIVVGFLTLVEVLSFDDPDGYIKMNGIAVLPEYRRRGIALQLVARAEQEARDRGSNSIGVATSMKRKESQAMLDQLGYQKSGFWFHKIYHH